MKIMEKELRELVNGLIDVLPGNHTRKEELKNSLTGQTIDVDNTLKLAEEIVDEYREERLELTRGIIGLGLLDVKDAMDQTINRIKENLKL